jgi:chorismate mutase
MVPLLNFTEIGVPGRLEKCIRVLVHVNTSRSQAEMVHVYLREAVSLRPDLVARSTTPQ